MTTAQEKALIALEERLASDHDWNLDKTTLRITPDGLLMVKAVPAWKGWGSGSHSWYFISGDGRTLS